MERINESSSSRVTNTSFDRRQRSAIGSCRFGAILKFSAGLWLCLITPLVSAADETNSPAAAPIGWLQDTNAQEILRGMVALGEEIRSNQVAIEQSANEAREAAARNAEVLSKSLRGIQETITTQQQALSDRNTRELQAMQSSNRAVLIIIGMFTAAVALTLLLIAYFQWRISKAWGQLTGSGQNGLPHASNMRLLQTVGELENRVQGLEQHSSPISGRVSPVVPENGDSTAPHKAVSSTEGGGAQTRVTAWLNQGQSMLKQNDWEGALHCFDEVLALEPNHGEALVKKGAALERLKKLNEAFDCYDRAIAVDGSMTLAYLHKGGLCSRLERFKEALECYDQALRTHSD